MKKNFKNKWTTAPVDVEDGDAFAVKVVAVAGYDNDWAAYEGPSDWTDQEIAGSGDKLSRKAAERLFYVLAESGRHYRE